MASFAPRGDFRALSDSGRLNVSGAALLGRLSIALVHLANFYALVQQKSF